MLAAAKSGTWLPVSGRPEKHEREETEMPGKISVGSSAFAIGAYEKDPIPFDTVLKRLSKVGYDGVELFGARPYGHPDLYPTKTDRKELKAKLDDLNLEVSNYGADFWGISLGASDADVKKYEDAFKRNLEFCLDIGGDSIRVDTAVGKWPAGDRAAIRQRYVTTWQDCSELAAKSKRRPLLGVRAGLHHQQAERRREADRRSWRAELQADVRHLPRADVGRRRRPARMRRPRSCKSVVDFIDKMGKRIGTVHLIDSDNTLHHDETSTHAPFGEGVLDFDAIIEALKKIGYTRPVVDDRSLLLADRVGHRRELASLRRRPPQAARLALNARAATDRQRRTGRGNAMKFGVNTQIWVAPFQQSDIGLIDKVAELGFDVIELGFFSAEPPFNVADVKQRLKDDRALTPGICTFLSADRDITSADPDSRRRGIEFMKAMIAHSRGARRRDLQRPDLCRAVPQALADEGSSARRSGSGASPRSARSPRRAETQGVTIALEPLNRFETDFLNLSEQAVRMVRGCRQSRRWASFSIRSTWASRRRTRAMPFAAPASISSTSTPARTTAARRAPGRSRGPRSATR